MDAREFTADVLTWFAVQVWAGREQLAAKGLELRGYEVFLPSYLERRRWSDRLKTIRRPLFSGYLFCRFQTPQVEKINTTPGVIRIVGDRRGPLPIDDAELASIRRIVEAELPAVPWPYVRAGQRVYVDAGPLRGTEGVVLFVKNQHRLVVSISLLQRSVAVDLAPEWVSVPGGAMIGALVQ